jgi:hypothetical protein
MRYDEIIDVRLLPPAATLLAITVTVLLWILNQRIKQVSYRVLQQDSDSAVVEIRNSGHLSVTPGDYHSPLTISCGRGAKVLSASVLATTPGDLEDRCRTVGGERRSLIQHLQGNEVRLAPVLLNDGDAITVRVVAEDLRGGIKVSGHINGIRKISAGRHKSLPATVMRSCGAIVLVTALFMVKPDEISKYGWFEALPAVLLFIFGALLIAGSIYDKRRVKITTSFMEPAS